LALRANNHRDANHCDGIWLAFAGLARLVAELSYALRCDV
jgi:hypothetical protein